MRTRMTDFLQSLSKILVEFVSFLVFLMMVMILF